MLIALGGACARSAATPHDAGARDGAGGKGATADAGADAVDMRMSSDADAHVMPVCTGTGPRSGALGDTCSCNSDCASGTCADGVCCATACSGTCTSCNLPGSEGTCTPVPAGVKPRQASECAVENPSTCGRDGTCNGDGACRLYVSGASCKAGVCEADSVSGGYICDGKGSCKPGPAQVCWPYGCANGTCTGTCTSDNDCAPGMQCNGNSCGQLPNGRTCDSDDKCGSGHCVDGFCCNTACGGVCVSCDQTGFEGQCRPLGRGMADAKCAIAQGRSACGPTGVCDGFGSCAVYDADTTCSPPSCAGGVSNTPGTCDGHGTCQAPTQVDCAPFMCDGMTCASTCTSDAQCVPPNTCMNGSCGKKPMGATCTGADQCLSNFCVDGFCCESACDGACQTCGLAGSPGRCVNVAAGRDDPHHMCKDTGASSCGTDGKCDGSGSCERYGTDTVCAPETCTSGSYTAPSNCSTGGQCLPPSSRTCYPFACNGSRCFDVCTQNSQCVAPNTCVNGSCGLKPPGGSCSSASQCQAAPDGKAYCAQGVCCTSACSGACQACNLNGSAGTCSPVANGTADSQCPTKDASTCGTNGTCRNGACDVYHTTSQCKGPSCASSSSSLAASFCDGKGDACPSQSTVQCGSFTCDSGTGLCRTSCDNDNQCVSPFTCVNHSCGKKGIASQCTTGNQCQSGNCVEGVCCDTACSSAASGVCQSCKVANHVGSCTPVPAGGADPAARCKASDRTTCGLDGLCDGAGKCQFWDSSTTCRNQSCPMGGTQTNAATCDGKGACGLSTMKSCNPYACNVDAAICRTTCTTASDCASGVACNTQTNKCGDKLAGGAACGVDADCSLGHCVKTRAADTTGICCDAACTNGCQSCALPMKAGICTNIPAGSAPRDPAAKMCPTSSNTCGNTGSCDGAGACQIPADGTSCSDGNMCTQPETCKNGTCTGTAKACPAADQCHTAGTCDPMTGLCSNPPKMDGTSCTDGNMCNQPEACKNGICTGTPKACPLPDQCHTAGTCDPTTGLCSNPPKMDGTMCDDGDPCTTGEACTAGVCTGGTVKKCSASDMCHMAGTCDSKTGMCSDPPKMDGAMCDDGKACTTDMCMAGKCISTVNCPATECHGAGTCDTTGNCSNPMLPDGMTCTTGICCTGTCTAAMTCP